MSLDLDPIRKRLAATAEHDLSAKPAVRGFGDGDAYSECGGEVLVWSADAGTIPPLAEFIAAAPGDIAALLEEVERLRNESIDTNDGDNPYETLPCGDCDVPYRDHVNEEGAAPCDNFHFCQDTAADLRADCSDLWEANARLRAEIEQLRSDLAATAEENTSLDRNLKDCVNFLRDLWPVVGVDLNALRLEPDRAAAIETVRRAVQTRASVSDEVERLRSEVAQLRVFRCHVCDYPMRLVEDGDADDDGYLYACTRPGCHEECITSTPQMTHDRSH